MPFGTGPIFLAKTEGAGVFGHLPLPFCMRLVIYFKVDSRELYLHIFNSLFDWRDVLRKMLFNALKYDYESDRLCLKRVK